MEASATEAVDRGGIGRFTAWIAIGAVCGFGLLIFPSLGLLVLVVAAIGPMKRPRSAELSGLISGVGLPMLYVAYLNRLGPGVRCTRTSTSVSCGEQFNPWPWLAVGLALLVAGIVLFAVRRRRAG